MFFSVNSHFYKTWTIAKDKGDRFEKPLNMSIHYSQTLGFKKFLFENHLHTLTKSPFYTGPKDMADPVCCPFNEISFWGLFLLCQLYPISLKIHINFCNLSPLLMNNAYILVNCLVSINTDWFEISKLRLTFKRFKSYPLLLKCPFVTMKFKFGLNFGSLGIFRPGV